MSRIGKNPVAIPAGVTVELAGQRLVATGSLGTLSLLVSNEVTATIADGTVTIAPNNETKRARAMWGTDRKSTRLNSSHIQKSRMPSSA